MCTKSIRDVQEATEHNQAGNTLDGSEHTSRADFQSHTHLDWAEQNEERGHLKADFDQSDTNEDDVAAPSDTLVALQLLRADFPRTAKVWCHQAAQGSCLISVTRTDFINSYDNSTLSRAVGENYCAGQCSLATA